MATLPRGTVTFLFTDVEGSTRRWEEDRDGMSAAVARLDALVAERVSAHSGTVVKPRGEGDSHFCVFAQASDALAAAADLQRALADSDLRVRAAVHAGEAELRDSDYYGPAVNRAARLRAVGHGGQTLVSQTVVGLVSGHAPAGTALVDLGTHRLKDLTEPEHVHELRLPDAAEFPPLKSLDVVRHNLPTQLTSFVGREKEVAEVTALVEVNPLVTLTGAGGSGKTRLALQAAAEVLETQPDGAWFVELAAVADPDQVLPTVCAVFGIREESTPGVASVPLRERLLAALRHRRLLLVLDNCEHLIAEAAELVATIRKLCPDVRILATSREALGVPGEATSVVPPMAFPQRDAGTSAVAACDAVQLFVERAALRTRFDLTDENSPAVAEICRRLDGIPLAIELAAAKVAMLTPDQIAGKLDDRFRLLTGGGRTALPRHRTLQATIDWSFALLAETERAFLRRLSVFAGGFTLEAAEAVCGFDPLSGDSVLELVEQLVEKSVVVADTQDADEARFRLQESIRQYGADRLVEAGETDVTRDRHQQWHVDLAAAFERGNFGRGQAAWHRRIGRDLENCRAAMRWRGDPVKALRLATSLFAHYVNRGPVTEGAEQVAEALRDCADAGIRLDPHVELAANRVVAQLLGFTGDREAAIQHGERAADLADSIPPAERDFHAVLGYGVLAALLIERSPERSEESGRRCLETATAIGDDHSQYLAHIPLSGRALATGNLAAAEAHLEAAAPALRRAGTPIFVAMHARQLARVRLAQGRLDEAETLLAEGLVSAREIESDNMIIEILSTQAAIAGRRGNGDAQRDLLAQAAAHARSSGFEFLAESLASQQDRVTGPDPEWSNPQPGPAS